MITFDVITIKLLFRLSFDMKYTLLEALENSAGSPKYLLVRIANNTVEIEQFALLKACFHQNVGTGVFLWYIQYISISI